MFAIRAALATFVVAIFALFSVAPAQAVGPATLAFASTPGSFNAGGSSPAMVLDFTPGSISSYNRIKIGIFDSTGSTYEATSAVNFTGPPNGCHLTLDSSIVGCTGMSQGGFIELSNSFSGAAHLDFTSGLFTLPTTPGNYTIKAEMYSGGTPVAGQSATVAITVGAASYAITFSAGGGSGSQSSFTTTGTFTLPATTTFTPPSGKVFGGWVDAAVSNTVLTAGASYTVSQDTNLMPVWVNSGGNQQNQSVTFTTANSSFSRGSAPSFSSLAVGANVPAFTMTFSGFSGGASVEQINYLLGDPYHDVFYTVPGAVTNNNNNYAAWNPAASSCGITGIRIGGVAQTANSGITCVKSTYTNGSVTQYWNAVRFSSAVTAEISIDTAAGVFQVSQAGNLNYFATLMNNTANPPLRSNVVQAFDASSQSSVAASPVSFTIPVAPGQKIVGEDVAITATDLALSTDYSVVLRSTPQILAQGRTVSSSFNTSVTIPDNLEPGWHSITFSATRSDGAALEEKVYFKITADGTLLATSTDTPAELAFTGAITAGAIPLSIIVLLMGFAAFFVAREINPDFMRVMTLTRNADGELDFVKRRIRSEDF